MDQQIFIDDRGKRSESLGKTLRKAVNRWTPSALTKPVFLMNPPFTIDNKSKNNALMKDTEPYDYDKVFKQFDDLYNAIIDCDAMVYLLPSTYRLQDLPFVANLGIYLPHLKPDTVIVANFKSPPRKGEDVIGIKFFDSLGYSVHRPSTTWEGEADLKWIRKNLYAGGYGIRTDIKSFHWMMDKFDMEIIPCKMSDEKLYHFDCQYFPLGEDKALASPSAFRKEDLKKIEKHVEIVEVPKEFMYDGWTNSLQVGDRIFCAHIDEPKSVKAHGDLIKKLGYKGIDIQLSEFAKSGGDLSCLILTLNHNGRK